MDEISKVNTNGVEDEGFIPRCNGYRCTTCGKGYLSVDLAEGTTPMFMTCLRTRNCGGQAISMGYPKGTPPLGIPLLIEWVKPDEAELARVRNPALLDHFKRGGLMRRPVDTAPDWVKALV